MRPRWIGTREQLLTVIRERREELDLSMEVLDDLAGVPSRYCSKLLAPHPLKNLGPMSLSVLLAALALKMVRVEVVEDPEQAAKMAGRWIPRKRRPICKPPPAETWCVVGLQHSFTFAETTEETTHVEKPIDHDAPRR